MNCKIIKTACVLMVGPDDRMDEDRHGSVNQLPIKCSHCTFRDLDYVAKPYLLAKGISSPVETTTASRGNFLVRERVKRILEIVTPDACAFHPTAELKSKKPASWWLAVPNQKLSTIRVANTPLPPRCSKCGEPQYDWGDDWNAMSNFDSCGVDVFKSLAWKGTDMQSTVESINRDRQTAGEPALPWSHWGIEPPPHPEYWTRIGDRDLYFSVRLEQLLKRLKVKGQLVRYYYHRDLKPSAPDDVWIDEKITLLAEHGLIDAPKTKEKKSSAAQKWFKQFLKKNAGVTPISANCEAMEKKNRIVLPADYKEFVSVVGPKSFLDVCEMEGSTTTVLLPKQLNFEDYRRGKVPFLEGDDAEVDGVMFAATDMGDCFVFDISGKEKDYPVFWYRHEENTMEPFASNFAECIKRFVERR